MSEKSLEILQAEAKVAKEAAEAAAELARQAEITARKQREELERIERAKQEELERAARLAENEKLAEQAIAALGENGITAFLDEPYNSFSDFPTINIEDAGRFMLELDTWYSDRSSWHPRKKGVQFKLTNHHYERSYYKPRKDGSYNFKGMAKRVVEMIAAKKAYEEGKNTKASNTQKSKAIIARLTDKHGVPAYTGANYKDLDNVELKLYANEFNGEKVQVTMKRSMTEKEAEALIVFLKTLANDRS